MPIVCGTDLSQSALDALAASIAIASRRGDAQLVLVYAVDAAQAEDEDAREVLVAGAQRRLAHEAEVAAAAGKVAVRAEVVVGPAVTSLVAFAETESADLLVVGSKGYTNSPVYRLGGTAERLVQAAPMPVLVVRDAAPFAAWSRGERALRVLVGVDDSAACEGAVRLAARLRAAGPVDLVVGHVYYADEAAHRYGLRIANVVDTNPEVEKLLERDLARRFGEVEGAGTVKFRARRGLGRIGDHVLELADEEGVDLIAIGTRQKAGIGRVSSVSSVILHDAKPSVLCIPALTAPVEAAVPRFRVAVVPTDLSDFANRAVPYAYGIVGGVDGAEVHLVHVIDEDAAADEGALADKLRALAPRGAKATTMAHVARGEDAARVVGETAERVGADVVCIASHGRSGITRALMGSVADKLMRACRRPVLVLRPPTE
jgi:nucleotide-binding universal stress UspA family protein